MGSDSVVFDTVLDYSTLKLWERPVRHAGIYRRSSAPTNGQ